MNEVGDGVVHSERGSVQVSADLHVVSGQEAHCRLVLVVKDLPLEGGAQQEHEVIWEEETGDRRRVEVRRAGQRHTTG